MVASSLRQVAKLCSTAHLAVGPTQPRVFVGGSDAVPRLAVELRRPLALGPRWPLRERCRDERRRGDGHGAILQSDPEFRAKNEHKRLTGLGPGFYTERSYFRSIESVDRQNYYYWTVTRNRIRDLGLFRRRLRPHVHGTCATDAELR